mmetsp:Transcript_49334/g.120339  ORF Transcript_49334/g.120339 Transcript_49334/m.120339 type:complete len:413 (+) Transcript_49334:152-1390(+)
MAPGGCACVDSCSDGPRAACRIVQAIIACLLLFIGICMQLTAGTHVDDLPLRVLCETYSGNPDVMEKSDFEALSAYYRSFAGVCTNPNGCAPTYAQVASFFLSSNAFAQFQQRVDLMRYADISFYCKYAPNQVSSNASETCRDVREACGGCSPFPCRLYPNQPTSPVDQSNWFLATGLFTYGPIAHVNCDEKTDVFRSFVSAIFKDQSDWEQRDVDAAAIQFHYTCLVDKGSSAYILNCGPVIALLGGIITTATLFKCAHGPPWPEVGINLLTLALIILFVGFWSISISTVSEISQYSICGDEAPPVTYKGRRYDGRPCIDRDSEGHVGYDKWNPFVYLLSMVYSTYIVGGVMTFVSVLMFLGLLTGFTETMMGDRFGKYLVSLQDTIPYKVRLPFPPKSRGGGQPSGQASE